MNAANRVGRVTIGASQRVHTAQKSTRRLRINGDAGYPDHLSPSPDFAADQRCVFFRCAGHQLSILRREELLIGAGTHTYCNGDFLDRQRGDFSAQRRPAQPLQPHLHAYERGVMRDAGNVRIMEIDIDDVPWKDELVTHPPEIIKGHMTIPKGPGWGTAVVEDVARAHPWDARKAGHAKNLSPARSY